ncbi:hypothetical protein J3B02_000434 [Coemansia erecta]|uniref:Uncharacterized protein n=1 Tax=Coemansia asiatica TaxID=1052880 RepID=A0A9W8CK94_9FUNG|nr:hypothetical protein LPJ64_001839 [Coemansia asiatica]KAJ2858222.1 hypothetical protein J3B02_000434 [Coemansia erecta]KAJ2877562.1 hypothetical protein FB639_003701 [Coemansia asiatica]
MTVRQATHAGSWYSDDASTLDRELQQWLDQVPATVEEIEPAGGCIAVPISGARAIIGPHAGYSYSGSNAAFAYRCIDTTNIKRVFLLGPSHHVYLSNKCALSQCSEYETPLGNIRIDVKTVEELRMRGEWQTMGLGVDEDEHSLEMHLPYIYKVFEHKIDRVTLVPILVGGLRFDGEQYYGGLLADYLKDPQNLFVVSSDFCHWGSRFRYTYYQELADEGTNVAGRATHLSSRSGRALKTPIWKSIERLDWDGMEAVARMDHAGFKRYLDDTQNTICGRHPIGVLLAAVNRLYPVDNAQSEMPRLRFVKYDQSSKVSLPSDSSVSYASAYLFLPS